jgi:hypothetical protein
MIGYTILRLETYPQDAGTRPLALSHVYYNFSDPNGFRGQSRRPPMEAAVNKLWSQLS